MNDTLDELGLDDIREKLVHLAAEHDCQELVTAYDAVMDAIKACEDNPALMQDLSAEMAPMMQAAPQLIMKLMMPGI